MYAPTRSSAVFLGLLLSCTASFAADKVAITITNDGTDDILVTVHDLNTQAHDKVLSHQLINGFASVPLSVTADASGAGHVSWSASTADPALHKCGRRDRPRLKDGSSVRVHADLDCPAAPPVRRAPN